VFEVELYLSIMNTKFSDLSLFLACLCILCHFLQLYGSYEQLFVDKKTITKHTIT